MASFKSTYNDPRLNRIVKWASYLTGFWFFIQAVTSQPFSSDFWFWICLTIGICIGAGRSERKAKRKAELEAKRKADRKADIKAELKLQAQLKAEVEAELKAERGE